MNAESMLKEYRARQSHLDNKADIRQDGRCENRNMCVYYSRRCNDQMFVDGCTHREMTMELKRPNGKAYHRKTDTRES